VYCSRLGFFGAARSVLHAGVAESRPGSFSLLQKFLLPDVLLCARGCLSVMIFSVILSIRVHCAGFGPALVEASRVAASLSCWLLSLVIPIHASISFGCVNRGDINIALESLDQKTREFVI
jgi:hypothetical protein